LPELPKSLRILSCTDYQIKKVPAHVTEFHFVSTNFKYTPDVDTDMKNIINIEHHKEECK